MNRNLFLLNKENNSQLNNFDQHNRNQIDIKLQELDISKKNIVKKINFDNYVIEKIPQNNLNNINFDKLKIVSPYEQTYLNQNDQQQEIIQSLLQQDNIQCNILQNHEIPAKHRSKMIDWMIEVFSSYKFQDQSLFLSVQIMDNYFKNCQKRLNSNELHLIGVTCIFIASKYEEIYPLRLKTLYQKVAHCKVTIDQIKNQEAEILCTINYNLTQMTIRDNVQLIIQLVKPVLKDYIEYYFNKAIVLLSKMVIIDFDLVNCFNKMELALSVIQIAFTMVKKISFQFDLSEKISQIAEKLQIPQDKFKLISQKILILAQEFDTKHPSLTNLKKFNELPKIF